MKKPNILIIIPARGGSKGVPRKNIKLLAGKPLIAYTIEAALKVKALSRVVVSTEDNEIAEVSMRYGAEVIKRPSVLATDIAPTEPVLIHAVKYLKEKEGYLPDFVVLLQLTSPLRNTAIIDDCMKKILNEKLDSVLTVCEDKHFIWTFKAGKLTANYNYKKRPRRQDYKPNYRENGAVYVTKTDLLIKTKNRLAGKIGIVAMEPEDSMEIDSEFDFWLTEQLLQYRRKG